MKCDVPRREFYERGFMCITDERFLVSNPSRAKGTSWEVELLEHLRELFGPDVHRAPLRGVHDWGDFVNTPWLHEAKCTKAPHFLEWARDAQKKAQSASWCVLWHGDRRTTPTELVVMPLSLYKYLVERALQ